MSKKRRSYGHEFKVEAVRLVEEEGYTMAEAGRSLGISANLLTRWKQKFTAERQSESHGFVIGEEKEELRRLRKENRRLRMERDILKKATAYFAKESL